MNSKKANQLFLFKLRDKRKILFIFYGGLNFIITNVILQLNLLFLPTYFSTLISQIFNMNFGFYTYGFKVFEVRNFSKIYYFKYLVFHILIWIFNWLSINFINNYNISKNLAALIVLPFLALISFVYQKNIVFIKKIN
tara:strand:+ start:995 stop:1408 length:414 start_codon:yes stop_codon:yes gene_type:complete